MSQWQFFLVNQVLLHCIKIYFKNLAKVRWKIKNLHSNLSNPIYFTKRIYVQSKVDFTKDGTSNVTIQTTQKNYHYGFIFLIVKSKTKPTTFYHHTLKYHNT
jgi:hypothetical protein